MSARPCCKPYAANSGSTWNRRAPCKTSWLSIKQKGPNEKRETVLHGFPIEHNGSPITIFIQLNAGMDR